MAPINRIPLVKGNLSRNRFIVFLGLVLKLKYDGIKLHFKKDTSDNVLCLKFLKVNSRRWESLIHTKDSPVLKHATS